MRDVLCISSSLDLLVERDIIRPRLFVVELRYLNIADFHVVSPIFNPENDLVGQKTKHLSRYYFEVISINLARFDWLLFQQNSCT